MDMAQLGSLLGRLLFCYLFVWVVCLCISRFKYKLSVHRLHSPWGIGAIFLLFLVPLAQSLFMSVSS